MKPFRAVLFDLDGTLLHTQPPSFEQFCRAVSLFGLELSEEQRRLGRRWAHWYWAESDDLHADLALFKGTYESAEFWSLHAWRHLTSMGVDDAWARRMGPAITQEIRERGQPQEYVPGEAKAILTQLQSRGLHLGLVSNRREPLHDIAAQLEVEHHFDLLLSAGEVGAWKPNPGLLQAAAEKISIEPYESIYVGDNYYSDVVAADAAGMQPVLYDPDGLFHEAQCPVITCFDQLADILKLKTTGL